MTRDAIQEFLAGRADPWRRRDPAALAAGYADDGVLTSPFFGTRRGRDAIEDSYRSLFHTFPDWELTSSNPLIDGQRVVQQFHVTATHTREFLGLEGTGQRFEIDGVRLFEMAGDPVRIVHERRFYDFSGLLIHMGVLQAKPR
jgi:predicted ester cyclase